MGPKLLTDISDTKVFIATKLDDGWNINALPQLQNIQCKHNLNRNGFIEWILEWNIPIVVNLDKQNSFLILYLYKGDQKADVYVLHICRLNYSSISTIGNNFISYHCVSNDKLNDDENFIVNYLNEHGYNIVHKNFIIKYLNKHGYNIKGNNPTKITFDEFDLEDTIMSTNPSRVYRAIYITDIYYNAPYTTVKWNDNTTTTVKATDGEEFNKEIGLAMAISRKYYECLGALNPRASFKRAVKHAHDQTAKTAARREYKSRKLLKAADISVEKETSDED